MAFDAKAFESFATQRHKLDTDYSHMGRSWKAGRNKSKAKSQWNQFMGDMDVRNWLDGIAYGTNNVKMQKQLSSNSDWASMKETLDSSDQGKWYQRYVESGLSMDEFKTQAGEWDKVGVTSLAAFEEYGRQEAKIAEAEREAEEKFQLEQLLGRQRDSQKSQLDKYGQSVVGVEFGKAERRKEFTSGKVSDDLDTGLVL